MMRIGLDKSGQKSDIYHTARQERIKPKGEIQMKNKKYYIAYGSNLSVEQMADRCPDAKIAGQAVLAGWELLFRGCATIAPNPKKNTPVLVWEISERDEENLDFYEGYPNYYRKEDLNIELFRERGRAGDGDRNGLHHGKTTSDTAHRAGITTKSCMMATRHSTFRCTSLRVR